MADEKQNFLGGLIIGTTIKKAVEIALDKVADSKFTDMSKRDVPAATEIVADAVKKEVKAQVEHVTNTEPWYQSRVTLGSFMAQMGAVVTIYTLWTNGVPDTWESYSAPIGVLAGTVIALYGRWFASKPIGR